MRWWRGDLSQGSGGLALSSEEGFVLSRLDRPLELRDVVELTGLPAARIEYILALLEDKGLIASDTPSLRPAMQTIPDAEYGSDGGEVALDDDTPPPAPSPSKTVPMLAAFATAASRDEPAETRDAARDWLRSRFGGAPDEAKAELIWATDGEVLGMLDNVVLEARTIAILTSRPITSPALVQNLARLSACPRLLLVHLLKQQLVRRSPHLKRIVLMHPNVPPDVRRKG